jgi:hypothetical protein
VKELLPLTPEQLAIAEELLRNPPPGSKIEAAREYGIDLMLMLRQLRLTPDERVRELDASTTGETVRCASRPDWVDLAELEALGEIYERITPSHIAH